MKEQIAIQTLLRKRLTELQTRNPAFSVRAFAIRLGLQPAATNEILRGERRVSRKMAEKIAARLHLDPSERASLLALFPERKLRKPSELGSDLSGPQAGTLKLTADQFHMISDWVHFAILNLIATRDFENRVEWIAERLAITVPRAQQALERLTRLALVEKTPEGSLRRTYARVNTTDDVLNVSIQKSHLADMDLARRSLLGDPVDVRDFTSLTFPADPKLLPKAKEIIRRAQDEISDLLSANGPSEVYRMTCALFPVSQRKSNLGEKP